MHVIDLDNSQYPHSIQGPANEAGTVRSVGTLHLSTIYRDMEEEALLRRKNTGEVSESELAWYAAGGFLWEHVFSSAFQQSLRMVRPAEWECDGIVGSPDGIDVDNWRLIELKFRWMSANKFDQLEKYFWLELVQCKGYCKMIGSNECELWVFFCNGDYRPPRPVVLGKLIRFSDQEIEESWRMIVGHAKRKGWL